MGKKKFSRSAIIYLVFLTNTVYSVQNGFSWPYWITAILTLAVLVLDILEVIRHGKH